MNCPRCREAMLEERDRDGVVVDACRKCRGLWLDRGELEKLIARATRDLDELSLSRDEYRPRHFPDRHPRGEGDDDRYDVRYPRRKRRWYESLADIFD